MSEIETIRQAAALELQKYIVKKIMAGRDTALFSLHDSDALKVVDAISLMVVKTIEHYLEESEERAGNGN